MTLAGLATVVRGGLSATFLDHSNEQRVAATSPDGRFTVVLSYAGRSAGMDQPDGLYLQTTEGFFSRRDHLGCLSDSGPHRLESVRFTGRSTVTVRQKGREGMREQTVTFDPVDVRVSDPIGDSCPRSLYTG